MQLDRRHSPVAALAGALAVSLLIAAPLPAQAPKGLSMPMPGIETFHPVTTTIACGSDATPESMAGLKKAGFASVISFRLDGETGFAPEASARAAEAAGLRYVRIPFDREHPDPAAVRKFLDVISAPETSPAFLSCHTGQRASALWLIKRVVQDGWTYDKALAEAESLGLTRAELKGFAKDFVSVNR